MVVSGCTGACGSTPPNYTNGQANTILGIIAQCMGRNIYTDFIISSILDLFCSNSESQFSDSTGTPDKWEGDLHVKNNERQFYMRVLQYSSTMLACWPDITVESLTARVHS